MKNRFLLALALVVYGASPLLAGSLSGKITLGVEPPAIRKVKIDKDQNICGSERASEKLILSGDKGVANAVISITGVPGGKAMPIPAKKIEFAQEKCQFKPHVLVIPKGAEIDVLNNDPITHNIHTFSSKNVPINKAQPASLKRFTSSKFDEVERIKVQCDIHRGLMSAWFVVADSPYTVVSDANGKFNIGDIPDGTYQVEIWHEALGVEKKEVTIKGGEAKLDVSLLPKK